MRQHRKCSYYYRNKFRMRLVIKSFSTDRSLERDAFSYAVKEVLAILDGQLLISQYQVKFSIFSKNITMSFFHFSDHGKFWMWEFCSNKSGSSNLTSTGIETFWRGRFQDWFQTDVTGCQNRLFYHNVNVNRISRICLKTNLFAIISSLVFSRSSICVFGFFASSHYWCTESLRIVPDALI